MNNKALVTIFVIFLVATGVAFVVKGVSYFTFPRQSYTGSLPVASDTTIVVPGEMNHGETTSVPTADSEKLKAGGSSYADSQGLYTFLYPNDYTLDTEDPQHIRIYKRGESQRPQSEMTDGVLVVFEKISLSNTSLEKVVDERIAQATADGTSQLTLPKKATTINGYQGFEYGLTGLGSATYIVLQKSSESQEAVGIVFSVLDPQQVGYQNEVTAILGTVTLSR